MRNPPQFNSVFTTPDQSKIVIDPELFFSVDEKSAIESPHLSSIVFTDEIVLVAIKEFSHNSAACPDGIPASLLINCAAELAPIQAILLLCDLFKHTFSEGFILPLSREQPLFRFTRQETRLNHQTTAQFHLLLQYVRS